MIILDMDLPKCCSVCDLCYDMIDCSVDGVDRDDDWYDSMDKKRMDSCPIIAEIPNNPTNGDVIKALFHYRELIFNGEAPTIEVYFGDCIDEYNEFDNKWWYMPYKGGEKNDGE